MCLRKFSSSITELRAPVWSVLEHDEHAFEDEKQTYFQHSLVRRRNKTFLNDCPFKDGKEKPIPSVHLFGDERKLFFLTFARLKTELRAAHPREPHKKYEDFLRGPQAFTGGVAAA